MHVKVRTEEAHTGDRFALLDTVIETVISSRLFGIVLVCAMPLEYETSI